MSKRYQVNTVQDMIDCTNSNNLENFLTDLKSLIESAHSLNNLTREIAKAQGLYENLSNIRSDGFTWIDDGEHNVNITLKPE